jgi:hypothetical protein
MQIHFFVCRAGYSTDSEILCYSCGYVRTERVAYACCAAPVWVCMRLAYACLQHLCAARVP